MPRIKKETKGRPGQSEMREGLTSPGNIPQQQGGKSLVRVMKGSVID